MIKNKKKLKKLKKVVHSKEQLKMFHIIQKSKATVMFTVYVLNLDLILKNLFSKKAKIM